MDKFCDFTKLIYKLSQQIPTYDEPYLDRLFCHYILMKIIFHELSLHALLVGEFYTYVISSMLNNLLYSILLWCTFSDFLVTF